MISNDEKSRFFKEMAVAMNIVDIDVTKRAYYGLIKHIIKQTRLHRKFNLLDFGMFRIFSLKGRMSNLLGKDGCKWSDENATIKFRASRKLREFIKRKEYGEKIK